MIERGDLVKDMTVYYVPTNREPCPGTVVGQVYEAKVEGWGMCNLYVDKSKGHGVESVFGVSIRIIDGPRWWVRADEVFHSPNCKSTGPKTIRYEEGLV